MGNHESKVVNNRKLRVSTVLQITSIHLVDTITATTIVNFTTSINNISINLATLKTNGLTILAETSDDVASVKFGLGTKANYRIESSAPYAICGEVGRVLVQCPWLGLGIYAITVTPYSEKAGGGIAGTTSRITLSIVNNTVPIVHNTVPIVNNTVPIVNNSLCNLPKVSYQILLEL